jgi:hypothetical protein
LTLVMAGGCSQPSKPPGERGVLVDVLAAINELVRGVLEAFPFVNGLGLTV